MNNYLSDFYSILRSIYGLIESNDFLLFNDFFQPTGQTTVLLEVSWHKLFSDHKAL